MLMSVVWLAVAIAALGCLATVASIVAIRGFPNARGAFEPAADPALAVVVASVTILKPLHGAEPGLYDNLRSFLRQDYDGAIQVVFGVSGQSDDAIPVVRRLIDEHPEHDLVLVVGRPARQGNGKIVNLIGMRAAIRHDVVVLSDSDMRVGPRYLVDTVTTLSRPNVGLVTSLYRGGSEPGLWATLASMGIDFHFFPSVLLGLALGQARPCMGATMAFTTETLDAIGGFEAFVGCLADDYAIGEAVRATGRRVVVAGEAIEHRCTERSLADLYAHELRWARTVRGIDPFGFAGSFVTNPLPFALAALVLSGFDAVGVATLAFTLGCRLLLQRQAERVLGLSTSRWTLMPLRDTLSFVVFCASYFADDVVWRGQRYRVSTDGTLERLEGSRS